MRLPHPHLVHRVAEIIEGVIDDEDEYEEYDEEMGQGEVPAVPINGQSNGLHASGPDQVAAVPGEHPLACIHRLPTPLNFSGRKRPSYSIFSPQLPHSVHVICRKGTPK